MDVVDLTDGELVTTRPGPNGRLVLIESSDDDSSDQPGPSSSSGSFQTVESGEAVPPAYIEVVPATLEIIPANMIDSSIIPM
jgi:hypothetical protein